MRILTTLLLLIFTFPAMGYGKVLTLATWNLDNFTAVAGQALRSRAPKRTEADFSRLALCAKGLDADVAALQEVASPEAVARLFPPEHYTTIFSGRYGSQMRGQRDIFNALVLKKGSAQLLRQEDLRDLALGSYRSGHWTRFGVAVRAGGAGTTALGAQRASENRLPHQRPATPAHAGLQDPGKTDTGAGPVGGGKSSIRE